MGCVGAGDAQLFIFRSSFGSIHLLSFLLQEQEALPGSGYEPQIAGSWDYTAHKYNCAWFAPKSPHSLWLLSSARDRIVNKTGFWHDLVHLLLLSNTLEKFQRDRCPPTGRKRLLLDVYLEA